MTDIRHRLEPLIAVSSRVWKTLSHEPTARLFVPPLLLIFSLVYYSLYVVSGLNLGGEGGTAAVVAMRLMDGQRPIVDTFLGYNVMWFFPVAWLFEITGPDYFALRCYFFAFCVASGLIVYFTVHRYTRSAWYSVIPAVLAILIPGMLFRNYMPFLGILNAFLLTSALVVRRASALQTLLWTTAAGAGLGVTFLFRIDLGIFSTIIFLGLCLLFPIGKNFLRRLPVALAAGAAGLLMLWLVHLPFLQDARKRGYEEAFVVQYAGWAEMVKNEFRLFLEKHRAAAPAPTTPALEEAAAPKEPAVARPAEEQALSGNTWEDRGALARAKVSDVWNAPKWPEKSLALTTYLPIVLAIPAIFFGSLLLLQALWKREDEAKELLLYPLTVLGCSLTLFPQYFFFRPDTVHIAEMMVPFFAALATLGWACGRFALQRPPSQRFLAASAWLYVGLCVLSAGIYFSHAFPKASAGTVAARKKASHEFRALNGVNVFVRKREALWLAELQEAVVQHSAPGDYVLCLPYSPTINFMTDRASPLYNLYVDNATAGSEFARQFEDLMTRARPAVVVVDQRPINKNDFSRFRNWAPEQYRWLQENYVYVGRYFRNEVFVRKDKIATIPEPEAVEVSD